MHGMSSAAASLSDFFRFSPRRELLLGAALTAAFAALVLAVGPAPGDAPEHFISVSMDRFDKVTAGTGVVLRPWLQAFRWRTKTYSPEYILKQVSSAHSHHGDGFLFWNAANDYSKPFAAMPTMMANPKTYMYTPPTAVAQSNLAPVTGEKAAPSQAATQSRQ